MKEYALWLAKLLTIFVLVLVVMPILLTAGLSISQSALETGAGKIGNKVAVVEITGEITDSKDILDDLYKYADDPSISGIVLRIDSPGGGVGASQEIYGAVKKLKEKKPIVASMGGVAASGGLYSALGASKIFCEPGTLTGSIGVVMQIPNLTRVAENLGFNVVTIKSGELKDVGNVFRPMSDADRKFLEDTINEVHREFVRAVSEGRGIDEKTVTEFADGRIILGSQAKELKLVDDFGNIYDAGRAVFEILGRPLRDDEAVHLSYPRDKLRELKRAFNMVSNISRYLSKSWEIKYLMH